MQHDYSTPSLLVKTPGVPECKDAEVMVIGTCLYSINAVNYCVGALTEGDFYYSQHKVIFRTIKDMHGKDKPIDAASVAMELKRLEILELAGGITYIVSCSQSAGIGADYETYSKQIIEKAQLRRILDLSADLGRQAITSQASAVTLLEAAQSGFFAIGRQVGDKKSSHVADILAGNPQDGRKGFMQVVEERQAYYLEHGMPLPLPGVDTGFLDLDKMIEGLGNSNLIILAARPAMGKTAFALNIAENVAIKQKKAVGIFSLEMGSDQLVGRMLASMSGVNGNLIKKGQITGNQYQLVNEACHSLKESCVLIDDQSSITNKDLRTRARRWKEAYGLDLLVVDYLQLLASEGKHDNRNLEISEISRTLKIIAKDLDIPVLCLSQLNRKSEERMNHRPLMSDLRDSGAIEQDADVILMLHRAEYYDPNSKPGQAECIVAKNRHGEVGTINMAFRKELAKFDNLASIETVRDQTLYSQYSDD